MATPIEMPKLGNTVEECLLARWCKQTGETVREGELIAEIETDKATFELTAPVSGTLLATFFNNGDLVPVFANVCVVGVPGESIDAFKPQIAFTVSPAVIQSQSRRKREEATPETETSPAAAAADYAPGGISFSPRARRFAEEHNLRFAHIRGTGPGGRVVEEDLRQLYYSIARNSSLAEKLVESGYEYKGDDLPTNRLVLSEDLVPPPVKLSSIRQKIASRMRDSLATTAQYTMNTSAVATGLLSLRHHIKTQCRQKNLPSININEMVVFCTVKALAAMPEVNVEFIGGRIYQHSTINIGFACDTPKGLLVPVVHNSYKLTLPELALKIKSLTKQALEGGITLEDISGGTFTVSNLGTYGIESFSPILNPPQVAILGVNTIEPRPVRQGNTVEFIDGIGLSLTCDHQVIDGTLGARFLKIVKEQIEAIETISGLDLD
jgi:pyruvate dehydrogenase E2 component (dihydrolipoamide acetyltransferase)